MLSGRKTQTRRLWKPNYEIGFSVQHQAIYNTRADRPILENGQLLPVIPKRGKPMIWLHSDMTVALHSPVTEYDKLMSLKAGLQPLRIRITALRCEQLQTISEADVSAEGVESAEEYRELWQSINGKTKGARWQDNPQVAVITFALAIVQPDALAPDATPTQTGLF